MSYLLLAKRKLAEMEAVATESISTEPRSLVGGFLEDSTIPAAVFHSRALGRDFVLVRNEAALGALTKADQCLPVLFFAEAGQCPQMGLEGLRVLLSIRAEFGPAVQLRRIGAGQ